MLERAWAVLDTPIDSELSSYPIDLSFDGIACRVALDRHGHRHLLVPATGESVTADNRPSVLAVTVRKLVFGSDDGTYVDLTCAEADLHAEFDEVVADVLQSVKGAERPGITALQSIGRWRRLFRARLIRGLGIQAKIGLFAELTVL